jgi:hypothetical protein
MVSLDDRKGGCCAKEAAQKKDDKIPHIMRIEICQADQELQPRNFTMSQPLEANLVRQRSHIDKKDDY